MSIRGFSNGHQTTYEELEKGLRNWEKER